jgi:predicted molibdopterin-dependent oxidoreductase YjgC
LPGTHFAEKEGTYTNRSRRVQKLNQTVIPPAGALQDSEIFLRLLALAGENLGALEPSQIFEMLAREKAAYRDLNYPALGAQGVALDEGAVARA